MAGGKGVSFAVGDLEGGGDEPRTNDRCGRVEIAGSVGEKKARIVLNLKPFTIVKLLLVGRRWLDTYSVEPEVSIHWLARWSLGYTVGVDQNGCSWVVGGQRSPFLLGMAIRWSTGDGGDFAGVVVIWPPYGGEEADPMVQVSRYITFMMCAPA